MDPEALRQRVHTIYDSEREALGEDGLRVMLERGEEWQLAADLISGRRARLSPCQHRRLWPPASGLYSGGPGLRRRYHRHRQCASCLHDCDGSSANASHRRRRPQRGGIWGIQGTGIEGPRQEWRGDHAMASWRYLWDAELRRRGLSASRAPRVIERYPYLAGGRPQELPGFEELAREAEGAAIVSTADSLHHGVAYGVAPEEVYDMDAAGLAYAPLCWKRASICSAPAITLATSSIASVWFPTHVTPARYSTCSVRISAGASWS